MRWLAGRTIAVSVSPPEDMAQYGMGPEHLNDALGEISRQLLALGARIMYGGDLRAGGVTRMLFELAARYFPSRGVDSSPSIIDVIPYPWHAELPPSEIDEWQAEFGTVGEIRFMNSEGSAAWTVQQRPPDVPQLPMEQWPAALTLMRSYVTNRTDARIAVGGKTSGHFGRMPGTAEEVLASIEAHQPLFIVGGFGGAAASIARQLAAGETISLPSLMAALPEPTPNGLQPAEMLRLCQSSHVDEVVVLITRGLRRLFAE